MRRIQESILEFKLIYGIEILFNAPIPKAIYKSFIAMIERLIDLLPENQKNMQGLHENIASPQFVQGLDSLTEALNSENLPAIISSFGLDMEEAGKYANGVEAFVKCIIKKYTKK